MTTEREGGRWHVFPVVVGCLNLGIGVGLFSGMFKVSGWWEPVTTLVVGGLCLIVARRKP